LLDAAARWCGGGAADLRNVFTGAEENVSLEAFLPVTKIPEDAAA